MPAITVTYQMPDDMQDFNRAHHNHLAWGALSQIEVLCRNHIKHGDPEDAETIIEKIRALTLEATEVTG